MMLCTVVDWELEELEEAEVGLDFQDLLPCRTMEIYTGAGLANECQDGKLGDMPRILNRAQSK